MIGEQMEEFEKEEIMEGVKKHLEYVEQKYPQLKVLGIFVIGSQNYGLSLQTDEYRSNLDTVVIVQADDSFPSYMNTEMDTDNKNRIQIHAQDYFANWLAYNTWNITQVLFTDFKIIKDDRLNILIRNANRLSEANQCKMQLDILEHVVIMCDSLSLDDSYINKRLYDTFRLYVFARDLYYGVPYRDALHPDSIDAKILIDIKTGKFSEVNDITLQKFAEAIKVSAISLLKQIEEHVDDFTIDTFVYDILDEFKKQFN